MDVLWFRLPRMPEDQEGVGVVFRIGQGHFLILLDRSEEGDWQVGYALAGPLKAGRLEVDDLAAVQHQREWPTKIIQKFQAVVQQRIIVSGLDRSRPFTLPLLLRLFLRLPHDLGHCGR